MHNKRLLILGSGGLSHDPPIPNLKTTPPYAAEKHITNRNPTPEELRAREEQNFKTARALARGEGNAPPLSPGWDKGFMCIWRTAKSDISTM